MGAAVEAYIQRQRTNGQSSTELKDVSAKLDNLHTDVQWLRNQNEETIEALAQDLYQILIPLPAHDSAARDEKKPSVSEHSLDGKTTMLCDECYEAIHDIAIALSDSGQEHLIDGESFYVSGDGFETIAAMFFGVGAAYRAIGRYTENMPLAEQALESYENRMNEISEDVVG